jgi:hypothetical protein
LTWYVGTRQISYAFTYSLTQIKESALGSRTGDVNTCKQEVLKLWLPSKRLKGILRERNIATVKPTDKKSQRGWNDAQCALHLLPLRLHEEFFEDPQCAVVIIVLKANSR